MPSHRDIVIAALDRIVANYKPLPWSQLTYENWLKAVGDTDPVDLGDWEESLGDYELKIDKDDYQDEDDNFDEDAYLEARSEAYATFIRDRFDDWYFKYKTTKFPLTLYRAVCLPDIEDLDRDNLGIAWTDSRGSADCYAGERKSGQHFYTLIAEVNREDLDWTFTLANNMNPAFGDDEQEFNILDNTPVKVVDVEGPDGSMGISFEGNSGVHGGWEKEKAR